MKSLYYKLDPDTHLAMPVDDLLEWAHWFEKADRRVAYDEVQGYRISTVFLGLDHGWGPAELPVLFETMVFSPFEDDWSEMDMARYATWWEAKKGHEDMKIELGRALEKADRISRDAMREVIAFARRTS